MNNLKLTGYFNTLDKVKYGVDKKKRPYYGFIPFNSEYKKIKITYSGKQKGKLLAQVELLNNDSFPSGKIVNIIGKYCKENIISLLLTISDNKIKENNITIRDKSKLETYKKDFITIDPEGSTDLDDGFYLDYPNIDIIIASPVYFLDDKTILNKYLEAVSSRYYSKTEHLWGKDINSKCSLLKDNETVLMILSYNLISKDYTIDFKIGKNKNQYTYEYIDKFIMKYDDLKKHLNYNNSKELVQEIMILGNKLFTNYFEKNKLPLFYRKFIVSENFDNVNIPEEIKDIFNQRKSESAIYSLEKCEHELMKGSYSHFTSPLRRWVDCYHQLVLYKHKCLKEYSFVNLNEDLINYKFSRIKKFHREYNYLIINKNLDFKKKYEGYIFNFINNNLDLWCPELNRFIKIEIINIKLMFQFEIKYNNDKKYWSIYDKINDYKTFYNLGQKINFVIKKTDSLIPSKQIKGIIL